MESTAGQIIYKAFAPTLKMILCITIGFILAKRGMFPPASAKGVSTLSLNVGLPSLVFSSMITAFNPDNISAFGSLALVAILYQVLGGALAWIVREMFYVPFDFQWGILVMGITSNWGNLPVAVIQTLGLSPPFDGPASVQLGVAYASVFILIMNTLLFPLGLHKLCALDFREGNTHDHPALPFKQRWLKRFQSIASIIALRRHHTRESHDLDMISSSADNRSGVPPSTAAQKNDENEKISSPLELDYGEAGEDPAELKKRSRRYAGGSLPFRKASRASSFSSMIENTRPIPPTAPLDATDMAQQCGPSTSTAPNTLLPVCSNHGQAYSFHYPATPAPSIHKPSPILRIWRIAKSFVMPVTIAIIIALPCSLVLPLKSLFTPVDSWTGTRMPNAPNGEPPLAFILETTTFLGGMTVPTSLILLGASFARLRMPLSWRDLPLGAIMAMTIVKMVLVPTFGIFLVQGLRDHTSLYPVTDKMRTFVAILCSGTPAAINQLVVTQLYNPQGNAHTLAMFLSLQYVLMPILSTALAALALYICE